MNIDIEHISRIEKSTIIIKDIGGKSTKLYKNISLMKLKFSQRSFYYYCKNNANVPFNILTDVKNILKWMAMEQGLYAQVVMLRQKDLNITEENININENKFKFQGQSARSQRWFDLGYGWIEEIFSTHEPDFYNKMFQRHDETQDTNTFKMFVVPIRNSKNVEEMKFHIDIPMLKYYQNTPNSCCFSSLVSAFDSINNIKAYNDISNRI